MDGFHVVTNEQVAALDSAVATDELRGFSLVHAGILLRTPSGRPVSHPSRPLLEGIRAEAGSDQGLQIDYPTLYSLFCTMVDYIEPERTAGKSCERFLVRDSCFRLCAGPEITDQLDRLRPAVEYFERNDLRWFTFSQSAGVNATKQVIKSEGMQDSWRNLVRHFDERVAGMSPAQHTVERNLTARNGSFVLGLLLATSVLSAKEFAEGILALNCLIPGVFGDATAEEAASARKHFLSEARDILRFQDLADGK